MTACLACGGCAPWAITDGGPGPAALASGQSSNEPPAPTTSPPPDMAAVTAMALRGQDVRLRTKAIATLGQQGGADAQATLERLAMERSDGIRAAAVSALATMGARGPVIKAAADTSWRVRIEVARALRTYSDRDGAAAASRLLSDTSAEVQRTTVLAVAGWPLAKAAPLLLAAMASSSLTTRKAAAEGLAAQWPPAAGFPIEGEPQRRAEVLEKLQQQFQACFSFVDQEALARVSPAPPAAAKATPQQLDKVERLVAECDFPRLANFGPGLVEALDQLVFDRQQVLPEEIYTVVLPRCDAVFAAQQRLLSANQSQRRQAAEELVKLAPSRPLGRLATARLAQLMEREQDQAVWMQVLAAVTGNATEPARRLAYAGIGHAAPEVRRRACENLAAQPDPRHVKMLLPLLRDPSHSVVCAAVRALGAAGPIDDTGPLRQLLSTPNEELRLETAVALLRLGDPAGAAELERLALSGDVKFRTRVARAMGETADAQFVPTLVRLLDDQLSVRRAALEALPKVAGRAGPRPDGGLSVSTNEQVEQWKRWFAGQKSL